MKEDDFVRIFQGVDRSSFWYEQYVNERDSKTDKRRGKFAIKQALRAQMGSRCIALLSP
jgi:hypothetical protein